MKILKQLGLIAGFSVIGELISYLLKLVFPNLFFPGSLIGMILLFIGLNFKIIKYSWIESVGEFFVNNMGFFFIPAAVSIMNYFGIIQPIWWKLLLIIMISFVLTFVAVGYAVSFTIYLTEKFRKDNEDD